MLGSRIDRNANSPPTAANRRFTVAAANPARSSEAAPSAPPREPTAPVALRQNARNPSSTCVST
jgi:hypothetical protein